MDKKTILAFLLIGLIIILWPVYEKKVLGIKRQPIQPTVQPIQKTDETKKTEIPKIAVTSKLKPTPMVQELKNERPDSVILETNLFRGKLSSEGGGTVTSWLLKKYLDTAGKPVELIPDSGDGNLGIALVDLAENQIDLSKKNFHARFDSGWVENGKKYRKIIFGCDVAGIGKIEKEFVTVDNSYDIQIKIRFLPLSSAKSPTRYFIYWKSGLAPTEKNIRDENNYYEAAALQGDELLKSKADATGLREGATAWSAIKTKYFLVSLIPQGAQASATELKGEKIEIKNGKGNSVPWKRLSFAMAVPFQKANEDTSRILLYLGPMDYHLLKSHGVQLEKNMNFGWILFRPFSIAFLYTLEFLYKIVHSYGWALIIFSVFIKILFQPLMKKSMQSMKQMQELQPKINALREKYKNDTQRLNAETMKLYKTHGINPMGGCLPLLLQMPIFIALFNLFRTTIILRQAKFLGIIKDLSVPDQIIPIGQSAINVLPILMGASQVASQAMTMRDPKQKWTPYFMSIFMIYVFYNLAAGLNLYYLVFNLLTIVQELYVKYKKPKVAVEGQ